MTTTLLLDNSAWARLGDAALAAGRADEIADALEAGRIAACLPFLLEAGYSTRSASEHDQLFAALLPLPQYHLDDAVEQRALDAQRSSRASDIIACHLSTCSSRRSPTATVSECCTTTTTTT